ncbi:MAG TPA: hypothetical protein VMR45_04845 [Patescibacteria group bacterium]|nr:hypothetical protein [Patescibacteria group bacterium]
MSKPYCVTFAGVPGSSKSIVAHYLSERFNLPIFSNDNIRFEVREDLLVDNICAPAALQEFEHRSTDRQEWILAQGMPFIRDASVDRSWKRLHEQLERAGYRWFIISMELSEPFLTRLYSMTGRRAALDSLPAYLRQHEDFVAKYGDQVKLRITDETFGDRTQLAEKALCAFLK